MALRDEADIIITNPPFSLFREFLAWIQQANKQFVVVGSKNVITYKEIFPLIKANKMWVGTTSFSKDMLFIPPEEIDPSQKPNSATRTVEGIVYLRSPSVWYTNLDHGRRHQPLALMTMEDNLKYSKHKEIKGRDTYEKYTNYDAIEISFTDSIPSDYEGIMGVPISFLDKYCPEQFEIIGSNLTHGISMSEVAEEGTFAQGGPSFYSANGDGTFKRIYTRILIKHKKLTK
jgi:Adenine-specific methyltransferase EcoRI